VKNDYICTYFVLSFMLSFLGCYHLCYHLMLSFFTVSKCYHFYVIIFPCTYFVLSFMLSFDVIIYCYHFPENVTHSKYNSTPWRIYKLVLFLYGNKYATKWNWCGLLRRVRTKLFSKQVFLDCYDPVYFKSCTDGYLKEIFKVSKRENYRPTDFRYFYSTQPLWLGDFRAIILFNFRG
jgi:hypothetical protein